MAGIAREITEVGFRARAVPLRRWCGTRVWLNLDVA